jgi:deoxyhypusine synthase
MSRAAGPVSAFIDRHFRHFNAAALTDAANGYSRHVDAGGHMLVTLGGAMSTAELGISLAEMIRAGKVHAICCTGANLEEDVFNLVAHSHYERVPHYRDLTPRDEVALLERHLNRVTDTCIPEEEAMRRIARLVPEEWLAADGRQERAFRRFTRSVRSKVLEPLCEIDPRTAGCWRPATCRSSCPAGGFDAGQH